MTAEDKHDYSVADAKHERVLRNHHKALAAYRRARTQGKNPVDAHISATAVLFAEVKARKHR